VSAINDGIRNQKVPSNFGEYFMNLFRTKKPVGKEMACSGLKSAWRSSIVFEGLF